jgi:hypothetical protein
MHSDWKTNVQELMQLANEGLRLLRPLAEKARIPWREPDAYDDWERLSTAVYHSFVLSSLEYAVEAKGCAPWIGYDKWIRSYADFSFLSLKADPGRSAFVAFDTDREPFDTAVVADLDPSWNVLARRRLPLLNAELVCACRRQGALAYFEDLTVEL